ncbi:MAG: fluoride efflux transporter CrcB [Gammaproteobacteria bacterium]|nr:fluoride efflux transporter CrcB [Gammaproteobacteria bacterium]NIN37784.1 fluoride efflux transporter CrcB [Gammaproteobacteria bacterium]NIO23444.1 fluoride efflux transporter CrcB [Gammaproteobacteria bacterium]NIO64060.1 fluoride efflux transporter CrcB [Gammaproteobacteria bacterium]NIP47077.1 fluoride efflux transporter CrcB [Gammaproteobacteria bacterium]
MVKMLMPIVYVGIGGFLGAVFRYLTTLATQGASISFPYGTLISNVLGCFVIGIVASLAVGSTLLSSEARLFLATGVCGGYTTLSSLVYELAQLVDDGELMHASVYLAATFVGAVVAFYLGSLITTLLLRPQV